jgi:hypothetical protein
LREPTLHFFLIGLLFFVVHQEIVGDPRTIVVDPALKSDLARRFRDQNGRAPNAAELDTALDAWKREEALYHEALRENLEQQDPTIRQALADRLRVRTALELPKREPTQAELEAWLDSHKNLYDAPLRYHYEYASFENAGASAESELQSFEQALKAGKDPASLGRPIFGAKLNATELREKLGAEAAERIPKLSIGQWQRIETEKGLWLLRVKQVSGGLPSFEELRPRLLADWTTATEKRELERATQAIVEQYRFEEQP